MGPLLKHIVWLVLVSLSSCTDLLAVYQHDILLLRNVDRITPSKPLSWESLVHPLPIQLSYPTGLAADPDTNRIFVSEAFPNEEGKIFSVSMYSNYSVESMVTAVKSAHITVDEGMSYNPYSRELFWTDAYSHHICKAAIPEKLDDLSAVTPQILKPHDVVKNPRGLAIDTCNEWLYWSEQGQSQKHPSTVEMSDLSGNRHRVLEEHQDNEYFQGLFYDAAKESLVIGVTLGKESATSSCRFTRRSVNGEQSQDLLSLDNCYPFSLSIEQDMLYWADWGRQGIMRANISDPKTVVKLVHTPAIKDEHGSHSGVFGLVLKKHAHMIPSGACQAQSIDRKKSPESTEIVEPEAEKGTDNSSMLADTIEFEKFVEKNGAVTMATHKETSVTELDKIISSSNSKPEGKKEQKQFTVKKESLESESGETHTNDETEHGVENGLSFSEKNSDPLENDVTGSEHGFPAVHRYPETLENTSHPVYDNRSMIGTKICTGNEQQLKIVILVLALLWVIFMASTAVLGRLYYLRRNCGATQVTVPHPRQVKRFGPKRQFNSGNKSVINGVSPCSGLGSGDGVTINIEDCCQMTLCETPCYTSVKKEGKSYKINVNSTKSCEDKKSLLDDCEEVCDTS